MVDNANKDPNQGNADQGKVSEEEMLKKLSRMEEQIVAISKRRSQRTMVNIGGMLLILFFFVLFVVNIINFVYNYNKTELSTELEKHMIYILQSSDMKDLTNELQKEVVPLVRDEIVKQFKTREDEIHDKAVQSAKNLQEYLENDVHAKVTQQLSSSVDELEKEILDKYPKIPPERMQKVMDEAQVAFIHEVTDKLEDRLNTAITDISVLGRTLDKLKEDPEYQKLSKDKIGEIENLLIESLLELTIYNMNPDKAKQPAVLEGGVK